MSANMPKTLADMSMSVDEWDMNRRARGFENILTVTEALPVQAGATPSWIGCGTELQVTGITSPSHGGSKVVSLQNAHHAVSQVQASDLEKSTSPSGLAISQIRSGNSHFFKEPGSLTKTNQGKKLTDSDPQPTEVRVLVQDIRVVLMDGSTVIIKGGQVVDICESTHVKNFCVIRTEYDRIAPLQRSQLKGVSKVKVEGQTPLVVQTAVADFAWSHRTEHVLLVAHQKAYGMGHFGHLFPIEEGAKVLLTAKCNSVGFFLDTSGNTFVLTDLQIDSCLFDMAVEESIIQAARKAGVKGEFTAPDTWTTHRHHNDRMLPGTATEASLMESEFSREQIANLPRKHEHFPLPPMNYKPPEEKTEDLAIRLGYYDFASDSDECTASSLHGFYDASNVIWAAHRGEEGLSDIKLKWVPGTLEGTQAPFGACNAYVMITMINDMRLWHFGKGPVPHDELPIFTGLDEFWHEREGANVDSLHESASDDPLSRPVLTEVAIEGQMYDRQGYVARALRRASPSQNFRPALVSWVGQLQQEILRASDRSCRFGQRLVMDPIDPSAPRNEKTSTHPYFVGTIYHKSMPNVLYLFEKDKRCYAAVFSPVKDCLAAMELGLPLLNAYGEAKSTIVKSQNTSTVEVLLRDIPFAPARIASDEWEPVLGAIYTLGFGFHPNGWTELVARMPYTTRTYCSRYRDNWNATSLLYQLFPEKKSSQQTDQEVRNNPISPLFKANNTLHGIVPGLVDPARRPNGSLIYDVTAHLHHKNMVEFPDEKHPAIKLRDLNSGPSSRERRIAKARQEKIKKQSEQLDEGNDEEEGQGEGE